MKNEEGGGEVAIYHYRRRLTARELLPAIGVGLGVGLVAMYIARIFLQRTPLSPTPARPVRRALPARTVVEDVAHE